MNPFKVGALVIFLCLYPTEKYFSMGYESVLSSLDPDRPEDYCLLPTNGDNAANMPIPYNKTESKLDILYPDIEEMLEFKRGDKFRMLCARTQFIHTSLTGRTELEVRCEGNDKLSYNGRLYDYHQLECEMMPRSSVVVTDQKCNGGNHTVVSVGFHSSGGLILLYNACFDLKTQRTLYTWYDVRYPFEEMNQEFNKELTFFAPKELYEDNEYLDELYDIEGQKKALDKILGSEDLAEKYIISDEEHCLSKGHFVAPDEFYYLFQQAASYNYVNVAPQWQIFDDGKWADLEESYREILNLKNSHFRTVTGTYGSCELPDEYEFLQPLFLDPSGRIPVPMFYWKILYDYELKQGVVFLLVNNPYSVVDESTYVCENVCPNGYKGDALPQAFDERKVYCCTIESFEKVFGKVEAVPSHISLERPRIP